MAEDREGRAYVAFAKTLEFFELAFRVGQDEGRSEVEAGIVDFPASDRLEFHTDGVLLFAADGRGHKNVEEFEVSVGSGEATGSGRVRHSFPGED
eukprot:TRINITY_DN106861_c0_g1_i1.p2 TRINITY_DN106861_c0_g1~~TRINITY_DN106861_c0_g1_i1.p2  ORF type:complete len:106 (+),score=20.89 TRINITY_DN106861_c0_g1_i1:34-318(+)